MKFKKGCIPWNKDISLVGKICKCCGNYFKGPKHYIKNRKYCGHKCAEIAVTGKVNLKLKGRSLTDNQKNKISKTNKIKMKRITHHINGNHFDNRPENKMVMSQSNHIKLHIKQGDVRPWDYTKINIGGNLEL